MPNRLLAALPAIILSSIGHDMLMGFSMGILFPVFIFLFALLGGRQGS